MYDSIFLLIFAAFVHRIRAEYDDVVFSLPKESTERVMMQQEFLQFLGLSKRPTEEVEKYRHNSAPHFLRQVYNTMEHLTLTDASDILSGEPDVERILSAISNAEMVISYVNHGMFNFSQDSNLHIHEYLFFDIGRTATTAVISHHQPPLLAELRLYKVISPFFPKSGGDHFYLSLYKVVENDSDSLTLELVARKAVHPYFFGWIVFDVGHIVYEWQTNPLSNYGLHLVAHDKDASVEYPFSAIGLSGNDAGDFKQPFLVVFFASAPPPAISSNSITRGRRSVNPSYPTVMANRDPYHRLKSRCQRKTLMVSFADLGWDDWILAPENYLAYHCGGDCLFPLDSALNATNHAIIQTMMSVMEPESVPSACCAPRKLSPISVLYFDEDSNVILKRYREMAVDYCGCQ